MTGLINNLFFGFGLSLVLPVALCVVSYIFLSITLDK